MPGQHMPGQHMPSQHMPSKHTRRREAEQKERERGRTGVDDARGHDRAHLAHHVLMLVTVRRFEVLPEVPDARALGLLHEHQRERDEGALPHKVDAVLQHRLQERLGLLEACTRERML